MVNNELQNLATKETKVLEHQKNLPCDLPNASMIDGGSLKPFKRVFRCSLANRGHVHNSKDFGRSVKYGPFSGISYEERQ